MHKSKKKNHKIKRSFLKSLPMDLMKNYLGKRSQMSNYPTDIHCFLSKYKTKVANTKETPAQNTQSLLFI